jgi:hypothetical protein
VQITLQSCAWPFLGGSSCAGFQTCELSVPRFLAFLPVSVAHLVSQSFQLAFQWLTPNVLQPLARCPPVVAFNNPNGKTPNPTKQDMALPRRWCAVREGQHSTATPVPRLREPPSPAGGTPLGALEQPATGQAA